MAPRGTGKRLSNIKRARAERGSSCLAPVLTAGPALREMRPSRYAALPRCFGDTATDRESASRTSPPATLSRHGERQRSCEGQSICFGVGLRGHSFRPGGRAGMSRDGGRALSLLARGAWVSLSGCHRRSQGAKLSLLDRLLASPAVAVAGSALSCDDRILSRSDKLRIREPRTPATSCNAFIVGDVVRALLGSKGELSA